MPTVRVYISHSYSEVAELARQLSLEEQRRLIADLQGSLADSGALTSSAATTAEETEPTAEPVTDAEAAEQVEYTRESLLAMDRGPEAAADAGAQAAASMMARFGAFEEAPPSSVASAEEPATPVAPSPSLASPLGEGPPAEPEPAPASPDEMASVEPEAPLEEPEPAAAPASSVLTRFGTASTEQAPDEPESAPSPAGDPQPPADAAASNAEGLDAAGEGPSGSGEGDASVPDAGAQAAASILARFGVARPDQSEEPPAPEPVPEPPPADERTAATPVSSGDLLSRFGAGAGAEAEAPAEAASGEAAAASASTENLLSKFGGGGSEMAPPAPPEEVSPASGGLLDRFCGSEPDASTDGPGGGTAMSAATVEPPAPPPDEAAPSGEGLFAGGDSAHSDGILGRLGGGGGGSGGPGSILERFGIGAVGGQGSAASREASLPEPSAGGLLSQFGGESLVTPDLPEVDPMEGIPSLDREPSSSGGGRGGAPGSLLAQFGDERASDPAVSSSPGGLMSSMASRLGAPSVPPASEASPPAAASPMAVLAAQMDAASPPPPGQAAPEPPPPQAPMPLPPPAAEAPFQKPPAETMAAPASAGAGSSDLRWELGLHAVLAPVRKQAVHVASEELNDAIIEAVREVRSS